MNEIQGEGYYGIDYHERTIKKVNYHDDGDCLELLGVEIVDICSLI